MGSNGKGKDGVQKMRPVCVVCSDFFSTARRRAGYRLCLICGEEAARDERRSWTVVQEYGKGAYQFVTSSAAAQTLRETNQKNPR
jgi:hypothetical protein